ncbi:MAG: lipoate--protein ligase family protein [Thermoplasmata archaeon]|nr:MAG: lipoate--protein ligase family protein [Thermoplasmata archaeon]
MRGEWRLLVHGPLTGPENMAVDESLLLEAEMPTLRLYTWSPTTVSIGYFQSLSETVNLAEAERRGIAVVRRVSGGGAVMHQELGEVTYSVVAPVELFPGSIRDSYRRILSGIVEALRLLGVEAEIQGFQDVVVGGRKISGSAQARKRGWILQHGTLLVDPDVEAMFSVLRVPGLKLSDKGLREARKRVTSLYDLNVDVSLADVQGALIEGFSRALEMDLQEDHLTPGEEKKAEELVIKYESEEWLRKRP